jgi:hypothetical protein
MRVSRERSPNWARVRSANRSTSGNNPSNASVCCDAGAAGLRGVLAARGRIFDRHHSRFRRFWVGRIILSVCILKVPRREGNIASLVASTDAARHWTHNSGGLALLRVLRVIRVAGYSRQKNTSALRYRLERASTYFCARDDAAFCKNDLRIDVPDRLLPCRIYREEASTTRHACELPRLAPAVG